MNANETTVGEVAEVMRQFVAARNWEKFHTPKNLAMAMAVEAAEVIELFQWLTPEEALATAGDSKKRQEVADELSDVFAYLLALSNAMNIDLAAAFESKMERVRVKYPVDG